MSELALIVPISAGTDLLTAAELREMRLGDALAALLSTRVMFLSKKTFKEYTLVVRHLAKEKIGSVVVNNLVIDHIRQLQSVRAAGGVGPSAINHETSVIQQLLKRAGLWQQKGFEFDFKPLPLKPSIGQALTEEEEERLLRVASSRATWEPIYLFLLLSLNTTCGPKEVCSLRRKDVDFDHGVLFVTEAGAKNKHRIRPIPTNAIVRCP